MIKFISSLYNQFGFFLARSKSIIIHTFFCYKLETLSVSFLVVVWSRVKMVGSIALFSWVRVFHNRCTQSLIGVLMFSYILIEIEGLKRKLSSKLGANSSAHQPNWQVWSLVALWVYFFLSVLSMPYPLLITVTLIPKVLNWSIILGVNWCNFTDWRVRC